MKRVTFTAMCAAALLSASAADYADHDYARVAEEVANRWQFTELRTYNWNGREWKVADESEYSYSPDGLVEMSMVTSPDGRVMRQTNTYNSNGQLVEQVTEVATSAEGEFENSTRVVREYDERVTTFVISDLMETWKDGGWQLTAGYRNDVTRDDSGNVTMVEHSELTEGETEFRYTHRLTVAYDDEGIADSITECSLTYDSATGNYSQVAEDSYTYSDVKWAATDGQILSVENLFEGPNRIESATLYAPDDYEGPLSVTYGDMGSYEISTYLLAGEFEDTIEEMRTVTPLDDYGSVQTVTESVVRSHGNRISTSTLDDTIRYDKFGLIVNHYVEEWISFHGGISEHHIRDMHGTVTCDKLTGYPLIWVVREYDKEKEDVGLTNSFEAIFGGFPNTPDAVEGIETDKAESSWYDLRGIRIAKPTTPGIYIERIAGNNQTTVRKVVIK